jgi:hypothetical protein
MSFPDHRVRRSEYISDQSREETSSNQENYLLQLEKNIIFLPLGRKKFFCSIFVAKNSIILKG